MTFSDYQDFRLAVQKLIEGDDVVQGQATFSIAVLDLMVSLGEAHVHEGDEVVAGLRASTMVQDMTLTPTAGVYTLPDDLLELKELYFEADRPLEILPLGKLRSIGTSGGNACYAAQNGETLEFYPQVTTGNLSGSYYARPEALKTITWADQTTVARYPQVYLYAAMVEAMGFLGFDSRVPFYQSKFRAAMNVAQRSELLRVGAGSRLRVRAR